MIDLWKQELAANRDKLLRLDKMQIIDTRGIISSNGSKSEKKVKNNVLEIECNNLPGSFRKLEID